MQSKKMKASRSLILITKCHKCLGTTPCVTDIRDHKFAQEDNY